MSEQCAYSIILASASPGRLKLLHDSSLTPDQIIPADIDETPLKNELPNHLAKRLSQLKAAKIAEVQKSCFIIAADSVVAMGRRILPKASSDEEVRHCLDLLSGRRHKIYSSVTVAKLEADGEAKYATRLVTTTLKFKRLTNSEIEQYIESKEGLEKAGGYAIQGRAAFFLEFMNGSFSNIVGLPLFETMQLLRGLGYKQ